MALALSYRPKKFSEVVGQEVMTKTIKNRIRNNNVHHAYLFYGPKGVGKCLGKGTPVIMFDGGIKNVEDIIVGDKLMGPDSKPRTVISLGRGTQNMYEVIPTKGDRFTCNEEHILHVKRFSSSGKPYTTNISIKEYLKLSDRQKEFTVFLKRTGIDFPENKTSFDPYTIGVWLGDGSIGTPNFTKVSTSEIIPFVRKAVELEGLILGNRKDRNTTTWTITNGRNSKKENKFLEEVKRCVINKEKRIPKEYIINSRPVRLEILAGLIDTDGFFTNGCYEITTKYKGLAQDILYLCRSLGLRATCVNKIGRIKSSGFEAEYKRIYISGNTDIIPVKVSYKKASTRKQVKDPLISGFKVESIGVGEYYGFTLKEDPLFLLGDFTITHNTSVSRILAKALNCSNIQDGEPCGVCSSCISTNSFDIIELDAAQNNSVGDIRQLIARLMNAPIGGKYIVVILDEIHMLSNSAANCLLKSLEEPPINVVFILCTTEEGKVIPTIQSRCQKYSFKPGNPKEIRDVILNVCEQENIIIDDRSIGSLTQLSEGSYRNAISLLDKVAAYSGSNISFSETQTVLGIPDSVEINNLLSASLSGNYYEIVKIMNTLEESGCDMKDILNSLLEKLRIIDYSECGVLESKTANEFSKKYSKKLRRYLHQLLIECQRYFTFTVDKRDSLEFSLVSMADVVMDIVND